MKTTLLKAAFAVFIFLTATSCERGTDCITCEKYNIVETICEDDPEAWQSEATTWDEYRDLYERASRLNPNINCY